MKYSTMNPNICLCSVKNLMMKRLLVAECCDHRVDCCVPCSTRVRCCVHCMHDYICCYSYRMRHLQRQRNPSVISMRNEPTFGETRTHDNLDDDFRTPISCVMLKTREAGSLSCRPHLDIARAIQRAFESLNFLDRKMLYILIDDKSTPFLRPISPTFSVLQPSAAEISSLLMSMARSIRDQLR
jgi:hypothetical protein